MPWLRKYSARLVASKAPRSRKFGAWSAGTATTIGPLAARAGHVAFDEIRNFARTFADQAGDHDIGLGAVGDHVDQHGLADARSRHDAHALRRPRKW